MPKAPEVSGEGKLRLRQGANPQCAPFRHQDLRIFQITGISPPASPLCHRAKASHGGTVPGAEHAGPCRGWCGCREWDLAAVLGCVEPGGAPPHPFIAQGSAPLPACRGDTVPLLPTAMWWGAKPADKVSDPSRPPPPPVKSAREFPEEVFWFFFIGKFRLFRQA